MTENQEKFDTIEQIIMWAKRINRAVGPDREVPVVVRQVVNWDLEPVNKYDQCVELINRAKFVDHEAKKKGVIDIPFTVNEVMHVNAERAMAYANRKKGETND